MACTGRGVVLAPINLLFNVSKTKILSALGKHAKQIFGKSWDFVPTGLTPPLPPLPERWDFFREFFGNFRRKRVKYAIKTVLYKSWDWVRPSPPLLGPNSQLLPKICFASFPKCEGDFPGEPVFADIDAMVVQQHPFHIIDRVRIMVQSPENIFIQLRKNTRGIRRYLNLSWKSE